MAHRWRLARPRSALVAAIVAVASLVALLPPAGAAAPGIKLLGKLPVPPEVNEVGRDTQIEVFLVLPRERRMYLKFTRGNEYDIWIREYDLTPRIPKPIREAKIATSHEIGAFYPFSRNKTAYDARRDRILVLAIAAGDAAGCPEDPLCRSGTNTPGFVKLFSFDRKTLKRQQVFNLSVTIPGFTPQGMTYSAADDMIYFVGDINPVGYVNPNEFLQGQNPRLLPVAVVALEPETGSLAWVKVVPECPVLMTTQFLGAGVYRSANTSTLYFACTQTGGINTPPYPEPSGIVRLTIDPAASVTEALDFPVEYFPISGSYTTGGGISGVANFDPVTDRFYMQSQSETLPGVWVFDGGLSGWVGFIGALDLTIQYAGGNPLTGRYYIGGSTYIIPVEGRHTPIPQGRVEPVQSIQSQIYLDDMTGRLFFASQHPKTGKIEWMVYQDEVPPAIAERPVEYDDLTTGLPEGKDTISTYSGSLNGFGAQVVVAGGTGAIVDPYCTDVALAEGGDVGCSTVRQALLDVFDLSPSPGPRALFAARVPSIDVRNVGAAAGARALSPDPVSEGEYVTIVRALAAQIREAANEDQADEGGTGNSVEQALAWPHLGTFCLDAGEDPKEDSKAASGGQATVTCDLNKVKATAATSFETLATEGLSVAFSSFEAESHRDPKLGIITSATAVARGVRIEAPGAGTVDIGRVVAKSSTQAHGARGSAAATWERIFEGVVVKNAGGDVVFECSTGKDCDPATAVAAMNRVLQTKMQVKLPKAEVIHTPGGAFAAVQESEGDYYNGLVANDESSKAVPGLEIVIFNDTKVKSRIVVQLAAIQASSIYGITPLEQVVPPGPIGPGPILPTIGPIPPPFVDNGNGTIIPVPPAGPVANLVERALFLIRSPKDALLFGLTLLLFGGAVAAAWRRRVLMRHLAG